MVPGISSQWWLGRMYVCEDKWQARFPEFGIVHEGDHIQLRAPAGEGGPFIYGHSVVDSFGERPSALAVLELGSRKLV